MLCICEIHFRTEAGYQQIGWCIMSEKRKKKNSSNLRTFVYVVMSFFLALIMFILSVVVSLRVTVFSSDYMLQAMSNKEYYTQVTEEMRGRLESLAHASGLSSEFANDFTASYDMHEDIVNYVESLYSPRSTLINTTSFKQKFRASLDAYIEENKKEGTEVKESSLEYLVNESADVYTNAIEIPFFSVLANYVHKLKMPMNITIVVLLVIAGVITAILFLTNEFRHRGYRYLSYAFLAAFLCDTVIAATVSMSGIFQKINIATRSLYNLFVEYFNGIFVYFWIFAAAFLVFGLVFFFTFARKHRKLVNSH